MLQATLNALAWLLLPVAEIISNAGPGWFVLFTTVCLGAAIMFGSGTITFRPPKPRTPLAELLAQSELERRRKAKHERSTAEGKKELRDYNAQEA